MPSCSEADKATGREWLTVFGVVYPLGFITTPICGYLQVLFFFFVTLQPRVE
jgi:hypothetical protein